MVEQRPEVRRSELDELLKAYAELRRQIPKLPLVVWSRFGTRGFAAHLRVPLFSGFVHYLHVHHSDRVTKDLIRHCHGSAAVSSDPQKFDRELSALNHFVRSLPSVPYRRLVVGFLLAVLLVAYALSNGVFRSEADARGIARAMEALLTLNPRDAADSVSAFEFRGVLGAIFTLALSLLIVAGPAAMSFRLERMLLNRYPAGVDGIEDEPVAEHAARADGIYVLEARAFTALAELPPREESLDLVVKAVALLIPIWFALILATVAATGTVGESALIRSSFLVASLWVSATLIVVLSVDALARTRSIATVRRQAAARIAANTVTRLLPRPILRGAQAGTALALVVALLAVLVPGRLRGIYYGNLEGLGLEKNVTFLRYLKRQHLSAAGISASQRGRNGLLIALVIEATTPTPTAPGISLYRALYNAETQTIVRPGWNSDISISPNNPPRPGGLAVNTRELLLLHLSSVHRDRPKVEPTRLRWWVWVPLPKNSGHYFIRLQLRDPHGTILDSVRTERFYVVSL